MSHEYFKVGTTQALINAVKARIADKPDGTAYAPDLTAGAALGITGNGPTDSAAWLQRVSTSDGPTTIRSIHGNTIVQDGELLSVQMDGIETVGFNQWDGTYSSTGHYLNANGLTSADTEYDITDYIPVISGQTYYVKGLNGSNIALCWYDAEEQYVGGIRNYDLVRANPVNTFTVPSNAAYVRSSVPKANAATFCINLSDPLRNGEYEPYWKSERAIPAATYFPNGMRSAGTVYDEQTATERITRVGERAYQSGDESDPTVTTDGTTTHYPLTSPTVTPIDPPLNLTYRAAAGGTERVMVPTGEQSAPPTLVTAQGYTAESLRDAALSAIAPVENGTASTNYGVGSYLVYGGQLCKVTTAIATGEAITIGTNVTATTVMAEVIALIAQ